MTCRIVRPAVFAALLGLAGCVGAPAAYGPAPGYGPPGYAPTAGYAPRPGGQVAYGATCAAGVYTCALAQGMPLGAPCSCPGLGAPSYGNVR